MDKHEIFMRKALEEARLAEEEGEIPVGAVVVCKGRVIARAHNQTERLNDVTAHAEMLAITSATSLLGGKYLNDCTLYVTLEPCVMCGGALAWAQLGELGLPIRIGGMPGFPRLCCTRRQTWLPEF